MVRIRTTREWPDKGTLKQHIVFGPCRCCAVRSGMRMVSNGWERTSQFYHSALLALSFGAATAPPSCTLFRRLEEAGGGQELGIYR